MTRRAILFLGWAVLGMVASYGALYAFSPFGIAILGICALVAWPLPKDIEAIGAGAGPGLFCWLVAASADEPAAWFAVAGRARCARSA
jgi:hypothetical protein